MRNVLSALVVGVGFSLLGGCASSGVVNYNRPLAEVCRERPDLCAPPEFPPLPGTTFVNKDGLRCVWGTNGQARCMCL
jgi:hypothetical protein